MSAAPAGLVAAVSQPGKFEREVCVGKRKRVKHSWQLHTKGVKLTTTLVDSKSGHRGKNKAAAYIENSPYRMRRVHVKCIGSSKLYRPNSILTGIEGTHSMYHVAGANTPKFDTLTTTEGLEDDVDLVLKSERGVRLSAEEEKGLAELKVLEVLAKKWKGEEEDIEGPVSGEETVAVRKVVRNFHFRTRLASCFCSASQCSRYEECYVNKTYPDLVPEQKDGAAQETIIMVTGVAVPGSEDERKDIKFGARKKASTMTKITGTEWQADDQAHAEKLWGEIGREEEPGTFLSLGKWTGQF